MLSVVGHLAHVNQFETQSLQTCEDTVKRSLVANDASQQREFASLFGVQVREGL
jgi:hypothetical protein